MARVEGGIENGTRRPSLTSALLAFLACPTVVGFGIPLLLLALDAHPGRGHLAGWGLLLLGLVALLACVRDFHVVGKGTLAPWAPPSRLVVVGLYRHLRNPMYLAVLMIVGGFALLGGSVRVLAYVVVLAVVFDARVRWAEEPRLAESFGPDWVSYSTEVRRWWPRWKPWVGQHVRNPH
jgi:protein-S-isoprenylcysteine O-methyltransferase Ste14